MDWQIKHHTKFSGGYVYTIDNRTREIWADNVDDLKRKVLERNLPWDNGKVPRQKRLKSPELMWILRKVPHHSDCLGARATTNDTNLNIFNNNILP